MQENNVVSLTGVWPDGTVWKYFDGTDFSALEPKAAFGIYIKDDAILLTQNHRGWDIPGGTVEGAETVVDTMRRELLEEVGLVVTQYRPIGYLLLVLPNTDGKDVCVAGYEVGTDQPLQSVTGVECTAAKWCALQGSEVLSSSKKTLIDYIVTSKACTL
jgi:8-oxo-dGTP pyrophosphatase MutT (NUDIX family)